MRFPLQRFSIKTLAFLLLLNYSSVFGQDNTNYTAREYLKYNDYNRALTFLLKSYQEDSTNSDTNLKIGLCYLNINDDKSRAIPYLKKVYNAGSYREEVLLYLGLVSLHTHKFDEASRYFNEYKIVSGNKTPELIERYINNCENAKILTQNPINVNFNNLGENINTQYPDFLPFVTEDEGTLYFTSGRATNAAKIESWTGFFTYDIYYSSVKKGEWTKAKSVGRRVNTIEDEQCVYISPGGDEMIIYMDNETEFGDLFLSTIANSKTFSAPVRFAPPVSTKAVEKEGCITKDGTRLIISSDRPGGIGGTDLYLFQKLPNGAWGLPINLGPNINTSFNEAFPYYDEENSMLYFSSEGHTSMGGYDIFKSKFDVSTQTFGPVINIGYPINTTEDNFQFTLAGNRRDGYVSAFRKGEGLGDLDIYKVTFNDVDVKMSIVKGVISTNVDSIKKPIEAYVAIIDMLTGNEVDGKDVNPQTGKFVFAIQPGNYILKVTSPGFEVYKKPIIIYDKSDYVFVTENDVILHKPNESLLPAPTGKKLEEVIH